MKKIVLSLAGVLAAVAFAPEAAAVPSFARQTGMACNACHFQSFPALNGFGRAFKSSGYTMMGAQEKIEGEHGLSIPNVLNASLYTQLRYIKTNGVAPAASLAGNKNNGRFDVPDEMALFAGGRGSENIGFLAEIGLAATPAAGAPLAANFKMPVVFDVSSVKLSVIPFFSSGIGASAGFDLFATGSNGAGRINENGMGYGAALYMGATNNAGNASSDAVGIALAASNETFHIAVTPYEGAAGGSTTKLGATYIRAGFTPSYNNWDLGFGIQNWSGSPLKGTGLAYVAGVGGYASAAKLTIFDAQAQGEVAGMPLGVYASYGTAPASAAAIGVDGTGDNIYNSGSNRKTAFGMMADLWVMPGTLGVQFGFMRGKTGQNANLVAGANETDNSYTIGARYKLKQNVKLGVAYTKFSGSAYGIGGGGGANTANYSNTMGTGVLNTAAGGSGNSRMTFILSGGF